MKKVFVLLMACASLIACDKKENDDQPDDLTAAELAALEKRHEDSIFIEYLKTMLIDSETGEPLALKGAVDDGTYIIGTADGETYTAGEMARVVTKAFFAGRETVIADNESGYHYTCDLSDGQSLTAEGSTTSKNGVFATVKLDIHDFKKLSTLLIKTEAALNEDNAGGMIGSMIAVTVISWKCSKCGREYGDSEAVANTKAYYCKKFGYTSPAEAVWNAHTAAEVSSARSAIESRCVASFLGAFFYLDAANPSTVPTERDYTCEHKHVFRSIPLPRCLYCTNGNSDMWALTFLRKTYPANSQGGSISF